MDEKGYIKYQCFHEKSRLELSDLLKDLIKWRNLAHSNGFLGVYPNGIGFGNISIKEKDSFLISGSATGQIALADSKHFSRVLSYEFASNQLKCEGSVKASSESMTHAAIYDSNKDIKVVLHIHYKKLWLKHFNQIPFTQQHIEYGTPEMAFEVQDLVLNRMKTSSGVFVMQGHEEGMISFGKTFEEVFNLIAEL